MDSLRNDKEALIQQLEKMDLDTTRARDESEYLKVFRRNEEEQKQKMAALAAENEALVTMAGQKDAVIAMQQQQIELQAGSSGMSGPVGTLDE